MRAAHDGSARHDFHAGELQHALVDAVQARDLAVLAGEQRFPVEARLADAPAVERGGLEILPEVRGVGEELLRDAADVDAGAAEETGLGDRDARPVAGADPACADAAGAASYREEVVVEAQACYSKSNTITSGSGD